MLLAILKLIYESTINLFLSFRYYKTFKVYACNHLTIGILKLARQQTLFPHPIGIVIGQSVKIGKRCIIYQNVTIGTKETKDFTNAPYPTIGDDVVIYANSIIFGDIMIGSNSIIGAGSVVFFNIPADSIVAGNPAKVIKMRSYNSK